jgi:hypothetical protein
MLLVFLLIVFTVLCTVDHKYWPLVLLSSLIAVVICKNFGYLQEGFASNDIDSTEKSEDITANITVTKTLTNNKYDNNETIDTLFMSNPPLLSDVDEDDPETGDDLLYTQSKSVSQKSKEAQDNRIRFTSDNFRQYFQEELDEQENRHWWDNNDKLDQQMRKDELPIYY